MSTFVSQKHCVRISIFNSVYSRLTPTLRIERVGGSNELQAKVLFIFTKLKKVHVFSAKSRNDIQFCIHTAKNGLNFFLNLKLSFWNRLNFCDAIPRFCLRLSLKSHQYKNQFPTFKIFVSDARCFRMSGINHRHGQQE